MAAPGTAYRNSVVEICDSLNGVITHYCAIPYDEALFLSRFKLDGILALGMHDGTTGWVGLVNVNGPNYAYHAPARRGALVPQKPEAMMIALNDAGLNLKGHPNTPIPTNLRPNYIRYTGNWFSSFHNSSTAYGFEYERQSVLGPETGVIDLGGISANDSKTAQIIEFPAIPDTYAGDIIKVRAYITNEEGTFYSDWISNYLVVAVTAKRAITSGSSDTPYKSCFLGSESPSLEIYMAASPYPNIGTTVWLDEFSTIPVLNGSYSYKPVGDLDFYYFYAIGGEVVGFKKCPEVILVSMYTWAGYADKYTYFVQLDGLLNDFTNITGQIQIKKADGSSAGIYDYFVDVISTTSEQEFYLKDEFDDIIPYIAGRTMNIISMTLNHYYVENNGRDVVYQRQIEGILLD